MKEQTISHAFDGGTLLVCSWSRQSILYMAKDLTPIYLDRPASSSIPP